MALKNFTKNFQQELLTNQILLLLSSAISNSLGFYPFLTQKSQSIFHASSRRCRQELLSPCGWRMHRGNRTWCNLNTWTGSKQENRFSSQQSPNPQEAFCFETEPRRALFVFTSLLFPPDHTLFLIETKPLQKWLISWEKHRECELLLSCFYFKSLRTVSLHDLHAHACRLGLMFHRHSRSCAAPWVLMWFGCSLYSLTAGLDVEGSCPCSQKAGDCVSTVRVFVRSCSASGHPTCTAFSQHSNLTAAQITSGQSPPLNTSFWTALHQN